MKLENLIKKYLEYLDESGKSPSTIIAYKNDLSQLAMSLGKEVNIETITENILKKTIDSFFDSNFSKKTVSRKINSCKSLFKYAIAQKLLDKNPAFILKHPTLEFKNPKIIERADYLAILEISKKEIRIYTMIQIMLQTGIRIGELSRLKLTDLKLKSNPKQILIEENGTSPMRLVEMNKTAVSSIKNYLLKRSSPDEDKGYLFNTKKGSFIIVRNIRTQVERILKKANLNNIKVNDFRNTFIVYQLSKGISIEKVAQIVGHRRIISTEKFLQYIPKPIKKSKSAIIAEVN